MQSQYRGEKSDSFMRKIILFSLPVIFLACYTLPSLTNAPTDFSSINTISQSEAAATPVSTPIVTLASSKIKTIEPTSTIQADIWSKGNLEDKSIPALAIDPISPNNIYAGTEDGVYKSADGGRNWVEMNDGFTHEWDTVRVWSLAIDPKTPTTIYAGTNQGVFKRIDDEEQWVMANNGVPNHDYINCLAIDPKTPTTIYAGATFYSGGGSVSDGIVLKSTNGGTDWREITSKIHGNVAFDMAINPITPDTVYVGMYGGVLKSVNGGADWTTVNTGLDDTYVLSVDVSPESPHILYAGTDGGVFKSEDGGLSWNPINSGLENIHIVSFAIDPTNSSILYVGTNGGGVYKSENGGNSWSAIGTGLEKKLRIYTLAINPLNPTIVYAGTNKGLYMLYQGK